MSRGSTPMESPCIPSEYFFAIKYFLQCQLLLKMSSVYCALVEFEHIQPLFLKGEFLEEELGVVNLHILKFHDVATR